MQIGQYIKEQRKEKGLTLREAAKRSGVSHPYLSQLENGRNDKPSPEVLRKISTGLDCSYIRLMEVAGYSDPEYYLEDVWKEGLNNTVEVTVKVPFQYDRKTNVGVATKTARSQGELQSWLFDLEYLLNAKIELSYKEKTLTDEQKDKVNTILKTLLE